MYQSHWDILGIAPTKDEDEIRRAYSKKLKITRPDDDPVAFQQLVDAREQAIYFASFSDDYEYDDDADDFIEDAAAEVVEDEILLGVAPYPALEVEERWSERPDETSQDFKPFYEAFTDASSSDLDASLEQEIQQDFERLVAKANGGLDSRNLIAAEWEELLQKYSELPLSSSVCFENYVLKNLSELLPEPWPVNSDSVFDFKDAQGIHAVVMVIDEMLGFGDFGVQLQNTLGYYATERYLTILGQGRDMKGRLARMAAPRRRFPSVLELIEEVPHHDRDILFRDEPTRQYARAIEDGSPYKGSFSLRTFLFTAASYASIGKTRTAFFILLTTGGFAWASLDTNLFDLRAFIAVLVLVIIAKAVLTYLTPYFLFHALVGWSREADDQYLIEKNQRYEYLSNAPGGENLVNISKWVEGLAAFLILIKCLSFL